MTQPSLLLLIPAYNEERRIEPVLRDYATYFKERYEGPFQLVAVLNGCRDDTGGVVRRVAADFPFIRTIEFPDPIGKGGALIEGLKLAPLADAIGYVDADGATPPRAFHDLVRRLGEADCVIGSRWLPDSVLHVEQSSRRRFASRVFHQIVEVLFQMHIRDTQCGAKVMRRQAVEAVHSSLRIADMAFDINLLFALKRGGFSILEVPTEWTDKIGSKVSLFRTSLTMFLSVVRVRLIYSPFYRWLRPLRPLEAWIYRKLRAPQPRPGPPDNPNPTGGNRPEKTTGETEMGAEGFYQELFELNPRPIWVYDPESLRFLAVNRAAVEHYGYSREEFLNMRVPGLDSHAAPDAAAAPAATTPVTAQASHRRKDGTRMEVELVEHEVRFRKKTARVVTAFDISERKREAQRASVFSKVAQHLSSCRTRRDAARIIVDAADALFGWDACMLDLYSAADDSLSTVLEMDLVNGRRTELGASSKVLGPVTREALERGAVLLLLKPGEGPPPGSVPFGDTARSSASLMTVAVHSQEKAIGVLSIQSYAFNAYTSADLKVLAALAELCGGALERIRIEEEILRLNEELERRVQERTRQLEHANRELEAFSYSVSHDLRAPLRSIRGFSDVLLDQYGPQLDARGQDFLRRACESCAHMDKLIDDLLQLSRVGRSELRAVPVDLSGLATSILSELARTQPERQVETRVQPGLRGQGDERLLRIALENLLANAWKFTSKQPQPRIEFGETQEPQKAFYVRDNGAGFDMAYVSKLFRVFQRLHSVAEFPGTGVGLATVQRVIARHGGRAWAEGRVNQGATFFFTLPQEDSK